MIPRRYRAGREQGFSALEATIVIAAAAIVAATAPGRISEYVDVARMVKAQGDVRVLAMSVIRLVSDVGRLKGANGALPSLVVSAGDIPEPGTDEARPWALPVDDRLVQELNAHIVDNTVGYPMGRSEGARWRGPYVDGLGADPWGSRYAINVGCLTTAGIGYVTLVISPGPDKVVATPFRSMVMSSTKYGDDVVALVSGGKDRDAVSAGRTTASPPGAPVSPMTNLCSGVGPSPHR